MAREKDNRRILSGVQRWENGYLVSYGEGKEDDLEAAMAPGEYETLKQAGALEGDWKPAGEPPAIMLNSKAEKGLGEDQKARDEKAKKLDHEAGEKAKKKAEAEKKKAADAEKEQKESAKGHEPPKHAATTTHQR